jgi:hypothetical protein
MFDPWPAFMRRNGYTLPAAIEIAADGVADSELAIVTI